MADNPIKYSDFVAPDNSIKELIKQLDELSDSYTNALKNIKSEAIQLTQILEKVSGATEEGRKTTKKAASDADRLTKAQRDLAFAESETARQIADLKSKMADANAMNKLYIKRGEEEVTVANMKTKSYNQLSAQYSINKMVLNNMSQEMREATDEGRDLEKQSKALYEQMKAMQEATGKHQLNVGNYPDATEAIDNLSAATAGYSDQMLSALGLNNQFAQSILGLAKSEGGAKTFFSGLSGGVQAFGKALIGLMANPVFLTIAGIAGAGMAVKFWFDYNKGLQEATKLTQQFTGLAGNDLKAYRNEVQAVADVFDKDFKEVLESANAVAKQFGIEQSDALALVRDGFVAGADANGEYLDTLKEYPTFFKEAGLSAEEFIAITAQTAKQGIYSDKGVDAIKEANLRIREMTASTAAAFEGLGMNSDQVQKDLQSGAKSTFDVMQEVSAKMGELPENSAVVGKAIADIFGGPGEDAGLNYLKTLKDIELNLDSVKDKAGILGQLQEEQLRSQADLNNTISALFDMTGGGFETMTTRAKVFINDGLNGMIKGVIEFINYFIDLYNESIAIRVGFQALLGVWKILLGNIKDGLIFLFDQFKAFGGVLKGVFTLDLDILNDSLSQMAKNTLKLGKDITENVTDVWEDAKKDLRKKIDPIEIPVLVKNEGGETVNTNIGDKQTPTMSKEELDKIYKKNLELRRKMEDAQLELEEDSFVKRREQTKKNYDRQIEDLKYQLKTEESLTKQGREYINATIKTLEEKQVQELRNIALDKQLFTLNMEKETMELQRTALVEGSEAELKLRREILKKQQEIALKENQKKPEAERQDESVIKASFSGDFTAIDDAVRESALNRFDIQQQFAQSEFDLLKKTEGEKTRFKLAAEAERLKKILELNETAGTKMSDMEVATIKNTIAKINQEIDASQRAQDKDLYEMLGINLDDKQKKAIAASTSFILGQLSNILAQRVQLAEQSIAASEKEKDSAQKKYDDELALAKAGYANDLEGTKKELELAREKEKEAQAIKAEAVKQQQRLETIQQIGSLVTASAQIWGQFGNPFIALPMIATMWGSFAISKIKARQIASSAEYGEGGFEFLNGGSHASGNDIPIGTMPDGRQRKAEGGELLAIINKKNTRRYRSILPTLINSLNNGTFEDKYLGTFEHGGATIQLNDKTDLSKLEDEVRGIRRETSKKTYVDNDGNLVTIQRGRKTIRKRA